MSESRLRRSLGRSLAIGAFGIIASAVAFTVGARLGTSLDHHTKSVSVANVPVQAMQPVAQK